MNKKIAIFILVSVLAGLSLGTIRKSEDPIRATQTDGILFKQKQEEEKDGKKGPLLYNVKNNPREKFFIDPPFEAGKKNPAKVTSGEEVLAVPTDPSMWWEEEPVASEAAAPKEVVEELPSEPLPEGEEKVPDLEAAGSPPVSQSGGEASESEGKNQDYWW